MKAVFELGMLGTGPKAFRFHKGKGIPETENVVVRVTPDSGAEWIATVQRGWGYSTHIVEWAQARAFVVFVKGAAYFLRADTPHEGQALATEGIDCLIAPDGTLALISTYDGVMAVRADGSVAWSNRLAIDGVVNLRVEDGKVFGDAGMDPPDVWEPFVLRLTDGVIVSPRSRK